MRKVICKVVDQNAINFAQELIDSGVSITNENEVIERIAEASNWKNAFDTLIKFGNRIHINFKSDSYNFANICSIFLKYGFDSQKSNQYAKLICNH